MSAIVGIYYVDSKPVDRQDLERMLECVIHRGPDGTGIWREGPVGLGQRMLWTIPESLHEQLPISDKTGNLTITADARIDNREELISLLSLTDPHDQIADSQLILAAYEKMGERCPEKLLGPFAFSIWDRRRQALFCARDHFGLKPFYYYWSGGTFVFGSEIKAVLCLPYIARRLNEERMAEYIINSFSDRTSTFYQGISRLLPGHCITVGRGGARLQCYYSLDPSHELRLGSDEEFAERLHELFTEAVRCCLRGSFRVGSLLSGGLDSSSVTCVARRVLAQNGECRLPTFSAVFDEIKQCDERPFIHAVLAQNGFEPNYVHGDRLGPLMDLDRVLWHEEEPHHSPNLYLQWGLLGAARRQGVRVILDGHDGDGAVSHGYGYLNELARARRWLTLAREVRALDRRRGTSSWKSLKIYTRRYGIDPLLTRFQTGPVWSMGRALYRRGRPRPQPAWGAYLNPDFVSRLRLEERERAWYETQPGRVHNEREAHYRGLTHSVQTLVLEDLERVAAAFSTELRHPFFDKRLVEFCLALPPEQKLHNGWERLVMRRAMTGILPEEVQWRGLKTDFTPSFFHSLLVLDREPLEKFLLDKAGVDEEYIDITAVRETYYQLVAPDVRPPPRQLLFGFWKALWLALWLRLAGPTIKSTMKGGDTDGRGKEELYLAGAHRAW